MAKVKVLSGTVARLSGGMLILENGAQVQGNLNSAPAKVGDVVRYVATVSSSLTRVGGRSDSWLVSVPGTQTMFKQV